MQYLIHIGYPKAASSLLQSTLFSGQDDNIKPLNINGKPYVGYQKSGGRLFFNERASDVTYLDPFVFDEKKVLEKIKTDQNSQAKVTCLSNELWAGHPFSGGITAKEYADRLFKTLPDAKILIVVRNQVDIIFSSYVHYITNSRGCCSLEVFLSNSQHTQIPFHNLSYYCYDRLVNYYVDLFSKEKVLVLPFEILPTEGQNEFFKPICDFVDTSLDIELDSAEKNQANYKRYIILKNLPFLNLLTSGGPINTYKPAKILSVRDFLLKILIKFITQPMIKKQIAQDKALITSYIDSEIKSSNAELQKRTSHDLKSFGYLFD